MSKANRVSNSFNIDEVDTLLELHRRMLRGAELGKLATSAAMVRVVAKFQQMKKRHSEVEARRGEDLEHAAAGAERS